MNRADEDDFRSFVAARSPSLLWFAHLLTGDRHAAEDIVQTALAKTAAGPYVQPSRESVWSRAYPISRFTMAYADKKPGKPLDPAVREFLRFIVSRQGMDLVEADGAYLPINPTVQKAQLEKLK